MTQKQLANHLGCDVKVVNRLVNGRTSVTAEMALKLGATFRTTPGFWLNAQKAVDLYLAAKRLKGPTETTSPSELTQAKFEAQSKRPICCSRRKRSPEQSDPTVLKLENRTCRTMWVAAGLNLV